MEDHYLYEVLVQTGPMLSHGTESKVQFILTGEEGETQIRDGNYIKFRMCNDNFVVSITKLSNAICKKSQKCMLNLQVKLTLTLILLHNA